MRILIVLACLALLSQYPPVKARINAEIKHVNEMLDKKKDQTQMQQDNVKDKYIKQGAQ